MLPATGKAFRQTTKMEYSQVFLCALNIVNGSRMRRITRLGILQAVVVLVGCSGSGSPYDYVPVSGKVTYEDGTPLPTGGYSIKFFAMDAPQVAGASPRMGEAAVDAEGNFSAATSYKFGDGLIPGQHRVSFLYANDKDGKSLVPNEYTVPKDSPLIVDTANLPLEIKVPKP